MIMILSILNMQRKLLLMLFVLSFIFPLMVCSNKANNKTEEKKPTAKQTARSVITIESEEQFKAIVDTSGDRLLVFDLYADWCMPCKILSPLLEEIAKENKGKASFYKINVDKHKRIAAMFGVSGIPFVVFVKNKTGVHALTGVLPRARYQRVINEFTHNKSVDTVDVPDGKIINGTRVIHITTATSLGNIYVYRGDKVKMIIEKVDFPYSIHIPKFDVSKDGVIGEDLEVTFKTNEIGVFPIFCNGQCPTGDGARFGQLVVMQYKASGDAKFTELKTDETKQFIEKSKPFILDVRTPNEYHRGHLQNAKLIPVQQLENRLREIKKYKNKDILVYCRSGNRSTVASQLLINHGFKKLYNMRYGIKDWKAKGFNIVK